MLLAWFVAVVVCLVLAVRWAGRGLDRVETAAGRMTPEGIVVGRDVDLLRAARDDFSRARALVRSPVMLPLRLVPFVGRQVDAAGTLVGAADDVLDTGVDAVEASRAEVDAARRGGSERAAAMDRLAQHARDAGGRLAAVDVGGGDGLAGPLGRARERFVEQLDKLRSAVGELEDAGNGFAQFLRGPRTYLVLATNNNEMRIGSGAPLSMGLLFTDGGEIALSKMYPAASFLLDAEDAPAMDTDQKVLWGWLAPNREWRNLGSSPRFDTNGELASRMIVASPKFPGEIDGVLALDPVALAAIIDATEPVKTRFGTMPGDRLVVFLLVGQYLDAPEYDDEQVARRDALSSIARQAVANLDAGEWDPEVLVRELREAAGGRHLLAWSSHPAEQRAWEVAGISGELDEQSLMVGLHNRGGNKLDSFLLPEVTMQTEPADGGTAVLLTVDMLNWAGKSLPRYIAGPYPGAVGAAEGVYQGILTFQLPGAATDVEVLEHDRPVVAEGIDGPNRVVGVQVKIPRGERGRVVVRFYLPDSFDALRVEPSARVPAVTWHHGDDEWTDDRAREIALH